MAIPAALSPRFEEALVLAAQLHARQARKGTGIPYVSHLLGVASLALEYGADEDQAIAALLHDAVEDQGGEATLEVIRLRFGDSVADIVLGCTDTAEMPKPPWRRRKESYVAHILEATPSVRLVSAADKPHNARTLIQDYRISGEQIWNRFKGGREGTLWYYHALVAAFRQAGSSAVVEELGRTVAELESLVDPR
jgi:(p)ppGpp synthase/HD superfamily hydrolase